MKTILYATDYSENSVAALKYAHEMSLQLGTRLVITHVFEYPTILNTEGLNEPFLHLEKNAFKMHRSKLEEFCAEHLGSKWDTPNIQLEAVENNSVTQGIISKAVDWHAYLIVTGIKGGSVLKEVIMGSTTKRLIEIAPCPIMAIPADTSYMPLKTIVYATDFEEEDVYAIRKLAEIAEQFDSEIKVVHISTDKEYAGETQMEWFKDMLNEKVTYDRIEFKLLFSDDIYDTLRTYLGDTNADIVVMLEREKKGFLRKWFHRDLVKKIESYGRVPLLSFRGANHQLFYFKTAL
ncbi:nucleotide-binding universal stress UspA family protein [Saonia flava]|uniref:Nucleotide-binding universal stress UspA family protein n=1 Tax=Saonia flava TaxID=523696 RepID=A0A846QV03_9FLAO|nr:universal stress protein [Saonia flava]NJB70392.1 nucleotide-binding universal stress UspA family protein [Saonia flava]